MLGDRQRLDHVALRKPWNGFMVCPTSERKPLHSCEEKGSPVQFISGKDNWLLGKTAQGRQGQLIDTGREATARCGQQMVIWPEGWKESN